MRTAFLLFAISASASAHVISMSTGWATVVGNHLEYILRMPKYELPPSSDPARLLFSHIHFYSGFESGRLSGAECHDDPGSTNYLCAANYQFSAPVERLRVDCTFFEVTVPNHIQMLHGERDGKSDQAILDSAFPTATLAFRPPTPAELMAEQAGAGAFRVWTSWAQVLLLIAVALASRTRRELIASAFAFLCGEWAGTGLVLRTAWQPSPRFAEAAVALALAYLSFEIIAFPQSRGRWLLALVFGSFEGMYFAVFLSDSGYRFAYVLGGAALASVLLLAAAAFVSSLPAQFYLPDRYRAVPLKALASALLVTGSVWFVVRLRG